MNFIAFRYLDDALLAAPRQKRREDLTAPRAEKKRIRAIDTTRGILLLLMISTHAMTLAGVAETSFFKSEFWLPRGWASTSFIMLSGFTLVFVFPWQADGYQVIRRKSRRRAKEILAVAFVSNIILLCLKYAVLGTASILKDPWWWIGLFTLRTEYTISAILLPTALLLFSASWLLRLHVKMKTALFGLAAFAFSCLAWKIHSAHLLPVNYLTNILLLEGVASVPLLPFLALGIVGITIGLFSKAWGSGFSPRSIIGLLFIMVLGLFLLRAVLGLQNLGLSGVLRFTILLTIGWLIASWQKFEGALAFLPLIGQYALFTFLLHRFFLEGLWRMSMLLPLPLHFSADVQYILLTLATLLSIGLLCKLRKRSVLGEAILRKLYL